MSEHKIIKHIEVNPQVKKNSMESQVNRLGLLIKHLSNKIVHLKIGGNERNKLQLEIAMED